MSRLIARGSNICAILPIVDINLTVNCALIKYLRNTSGIKWCSLFGTFVIELLNSLELEGHQMTRALKDLVAEPLIKNSVVAKLALQHVRATIQCGR